MTENGSGGGGAASSYRIAAGLAALNAEGIGWAVLAFILADGVMVAVFGDALRVLMHFVFDALIVHMGLRSMLSDGRVTGLGAMVTETGRTPWLFIFRATVLMMPGILALLLVGGLMMPAFGPGAALGAGVVVGLGAYAVTFALFGTMLADLASGGSGDPEAALEKGRAAFRPALALMLSGPVLAELCLYAADSLARGIGLPDRAIDPEAEHLNAVGLVVDTAFLLGGIFVSLLAATALGRAWLGRY
ncbi:MAG: hypothetical protein AAF371_02910 [Pseudomonadota bacterium]